MKKRIILGWLLCLPLALFAATLRDPTEPMLDEELLGQNKVKVSKQFDLQSILVSPSRRVAIINGRLVSVGSKMNDARVILIDKDRVILLQGNEKITLELFGKTLWMTQ